LHKTIGGLNPAMKLG